MTHDFDTHRHLALRDGLMELRATLRRHIPLVLENPAVLERMEGTGRLAPGLAKDFGLVGPAGRASGSGYDVRRVFPHGCYLALAPAQVRVDEIYASMHGIADLLPIAAYIPSDPPHPWSIIHGLLLAMGHPVLR